MSAIDPFRSVATMPRVLPAPRPPDYPPMLRLRRAGLRSDEVAGVINAYRALSDPEKFDTLERFRYMTNDELQAMIEDGRTDG